MTFWIEVLIFPLPVNTWFPSNRTIRLFSSRLLLFCDRVFRWHKATKLAACACLKDISTQGWLCRSYGMCYWCYRMHVWLTNWRVLQLRRWPGSAVSNLWNDLYNGFVVTHSMKKILATRLTTNQGMLWSKLPPRKFSHNSISNFYAFSFKAV